ncbi:uncharacterized protein UV8b_07595 [Ustilaginoidea virens]|uniref:Aminoglycoside phosphotransferase domain-containing protein n=1 Tax=Ustilaginoidea virens TaxID=1159556 RepID=A0A063BNJ6_USTVR|nr:uncharacterized protein UV8b_07595 [Ustilaginoidea virens]QUC23354.1 hypothetical protein UV8b_07595 [Ustilaginoidea virens]GAO20060.1 hypothetical protein UVI_02045900 [Ustilaginoidea virens]
MSLNDKHAALIRSILQDRFLLAPNAFKIEPVKEAKNNHVFLLKLTSPTLEPSPPSNQVFTTPIPAKTSRLVFRIPKENVSLEDSVRIRNEVAFLTLAREALSPIGPSLTPAVFGWSDTVSDSSFGWILEEWKTGEHLTIQKLVKLGDETQRLVLGQMAKVAKCLQDYQLPDSATEFGGLTFDEEGTIKSTKSVIPCGGPFPSYGAFLKGTFRWQLEASERSTHVNGWRDYPELRKRIDAFFADGLDGVIAKVPKQKPTLVNADIAFVNLRFDPATYRLTAVLDFDFSHVGAPISEHLFSFWDWDALLPSQANPVGSLREWMLEGFPKDVEDCFKVNRLWDDMLADAHAQKPSTIAGAGLMADLWWFSQELCQAYWFMERIVGKSSAKELEEKKKDSAAKLDKYLALWGF